MLVTDVPRHLFHRSSLSDVFKHEDELRRANQVFPSVLFSFALPVGPCVLPLPGNLRPENDPVPTRAAQLPSTSFSGQSLTTLFTL